MKTGDKVRLVNKPSDGWTDEMKKYLGKVVEVSEATTMSDGSVIFSIKEDDVGWVFYETDVACPNKYDITIRINNNKIFFGDLNYDQFKMFVELLAERDGAVVDVRIKRG